MAVDYVCGTHVDEKKTDFQVVHNDRVYSFCSLECKTTFEKEPERFIEERQNPWNHIGKNHCC